MTEEEVRYLLDQAKQDEVFITRVMEYLRAHRSASQAVTGAQIAKHFGFKNDRTVRVAIRELIKRGELIAASNHEPMGFYVIENEEEATVYESTLRSRALRTMERLRDFRRAVVRKFGPHHQMPLFTLEPAIRELER